MMVNAYIELTDCMGEKLDSVAFYTQTCYEVLAVWKWVPLFV